MPNESTKKLYEAASNAATALLSKQDTSILSIDDSNDSTDVSKVAKAAAKAERKQIKKAEKERRKMEKKKRKILEKQQQQMQGVCLKSILAIISRASNVLVLLSTLNHEYHIILDGK